MTKCAECGQPLNPLDPNVYQRVQGYERKAIGASRKSGSDIVCRSPLQEFAHSHCVSRLKMGLSPGQGSMVL